MTVARMRIVREQPLDWPLVAGTNLPDDVGELFVENRRHPNEPMDEAVADASGVLRQGMVRSGVADDASLWLVAWGLPIPPRPWVGVLKARRAGFWGGLEGDGVVLPEGARSEVEVEWADHPLGFAGSIEFGLDELVVALEVMRTSHERAVVVATGPDAADPRPLLVPRSLQHTHRGRLDVFKAAIPMVVDRTFLFVARANGLFDDYEVGPDVFARTAFLDPLEAALREVLAEADMDV